MSASAFLFGMFVTWAAIGVVSALVMGRRGYAPFAWLVLGVVFGPLVVPLAFARARHARELRSVPSADAAVSTRRGPVDVLVGIDGSDASSGAAVEVAELLGDRVGRLTLATVVDYDTALDQGSGERSARAELARTAAAVAEKVAHDVDTVLLAGVPADALVTHALDHHYDVIAVGSRGRGATKLAMGSVATRLARATRIPVVIVGEGATVTRER